MESDRQDFLIILEGGGTHSQALLMDRQGTVLQTCRAGAVNTNFVSMADAQQAVMQVVKGVLEQNGTSGKAVSLLASGLVGPRFGPELFGTLLPQATYQYYGERDIVFAQAGCYRPHGVGVVAATGATAWAVRRDDGREVSCGGWGSLLGDEGSAYAVGLLALRQSTRASEGRLDVPTQLVEVICEHWNLSPAEYRQGLVPLAYGKPLTRHEIAGLAPRITRLAEEGDLAAVRITEKVAADLASLALFAARSLFQAGEVFDVVAAGGLLRAGARVTTPLKSAIQQNFPQARFHLAQDDPTLALGKLALTYLNQ